MRLMVCLSVLAMVGCVPTQQSVDEISNKLDSLEKRLGDIAYIAVDPRLDITIQETEFLAPDSKYASPKVSYSIVVKQNNTDFDVDEYNVNTKFDVVNAEGVAVGDIYADLHVKHGVAAASGVKGLYSLKSVSDLTGFSLRPVNYQWAPKIEYTFVSVE